MGIGFLRDNQTANKGFTLIEVLVAMLISGIVIASVYSAFQSQQNAYIAQDQVVEMQQNIRAGVNLMIKEIRMAGYDPQGAGSYGIIAGSDADTFNFTADVNDDGGVPGSGETFLYELYDTDGDGKNDSLRRTSGGPPVAENIEQLEFVYLDSSGTPIAVPLTLVSAESVRSVQISFLAKADKPDRNFINTMTYTPASGNTWDLNGVIPGNAPDDNFRRRLLITSVVCRNMGL